MAKKSAKKIVKRRGPPKVTPLPWTLIGFVVLGLILSFAFGVGVGTHQGWVEARGTGNGVMPRVRKKMIQIEDGHWVNHGPYEGYYEDGRTIMETGEYFRGKKHGPWIEYEKDGTVKRKLTYDNGVEQKD